MHASRSFDWDLETYDKINSCSCEFTFSLEDRFVGSALETTLSPRYSLAIPSLLPRYPLAIP